MPIHADDQTTALAVPQWHELPEYAQRDLASRDYDADWFARHANEPALRLTVLTLYVKLSGLKLWHLVENESGSALGCLHFLCADAASFREALRARQDFTDPPEGKEAWDSRERRADGALHFKHFAEWPERKIQAHIDPEGLLMCSDLWWIVPIVPLAQMVAHTTDPEGYKDVGRVRAILLDQGWDPAPLTGHR